MQSQRARPELCALSLQIAGLVLYVSSRTWASDVRQLLLAAVLCALPALLYARSALLDLRLRPAGWKARSVAALVGALVASIPVL